MARLNARWDDFGRRSQTWDHFWQDAATAASANVTVLPGAASLTTTRSAPAVKTPRLVLPSAATLAITRSSPAVLAPRLVLPAAASLVTTRSAPAVLAPRSVQPAAAALVITRSAPAVSAPRVVLPSGAARVITSSAPAVTVAGGSVVASPSAASLTLVTTAPFVQGTAAVTALSGLPLAARQRGRVVPITPGPAHLHLRTFPPAVTVNDDELAMLLLAA